MRPWFLALALIALAPPSRVVAQFVMDPGTGPPSIYVNGTGEVILPADRAILRFTVQVQGPTAAESSAQLAQRFATIADSLKGHGFSPDSVRPSGLFVGASGEVPVSIRRPNEYSARAELRLAVRNVADIAAITNAVLAAGATSLGGVQFLSNRMEEGRRDALTDGFTKARLSAEALAAAAGRRLGEILSIGTSVAPFDYSEMQLSMGEFYTPQGMPGRVSPREVTVRASVQVRWRLDPGR
jgi:uncharacterized protein YggE